MAYLNKCMLIGNLGKDPEIRVNQASGKKVVSFSLATSRRYRDNNGERIMLADYRYRQMFGTQKPKGTVIMFKDGNHDNYAIENLYFISTSEYMKLRNGDPEIHARNIELLNKGREENIERERKRPWLAKKRLARTWATRRERDPEGTGLKKMVETRRKNAEERGFWYTEEQRQHFSLAHKGISKTVRLQRKHESEKAGIRVKLGMR